MILTAFTQHAGFSVCYLIPKRYYNWSWPRDAELYAAGYYYYRDDGLPRIGGAIAFPSREAAIVAAEEDLEVEWGEEA